MTSLKLLVNTEKNQVLYAESDNDFVDILLSFLTVPLGSSAPCQSNIGCLETLHKSVNDFDEQLLQTSECKNMLLYPESALGSLCRNLKVNVVGSDPSYYLCSKCTGSPEEHNLLSTSCSTRCPCGGQMSRSVVERKYNNVEHGKDGVFVKGIWKFLITDDLQVSPAFTLTSFELLKKLGICDASATVLEVRKVDVGHSKVNELLTSLLISKTPLTDVFLGKQNTEHGKEHDPQDMVDEIERIESEHDDKSKKMRLKLLLSRSSNKVLYAESGEEFPDLLLSFLTFPLGSVVKLLGGKTGMGCLDNLYKSVQDLSLQDCMKSEECTAMLLAPKLAPYFGTKNQILKIEEQLPRQPIFFPCDDCDPQLPRNPPGSVCSSPFATSSKRASSFSIASSFGTPSGSALSSRGYFIEDGGNRTCPHGKMGTQLRSINPKCRDGVHELGGSFLGWPAFVTDELTVQPLSPFSGISFINKFSYPISDLEEVVVSVGEMEVKLHN